MTEAEKAICDHILKEGTVFDQDEFICDGILVECFMVEYLGEKYTLNRTNGEWYYIHRWLPTYIITHAPGLQGQKGKKLL